MEAVKHFAKQRGIEGFSIGELVQPADIALDDDQLAPVLLANAMVTFSESGMVDPETPFPWGIGPGEHEHDSLFGHHVIEQASVIPKAVALLFIDYELEQLVDQCLKDMTFTDGILPMDSLMERLEAMEEQEATFSFNNSWAMRFD